MVQLITRMKNILAEGIRTLRTRFAIAILSVLVAMTFVGYCYS